jgi:GLPGLI family protein
MKKIILCIFLLIPFKIYSQHIPIPREKNPANMTIIDSGSIKVWYALNADNITNQKTYDDLQLLEIGEYFSKYYSYFIFNRDSLITDFRQKNSKAKSIPNWLGAKGKNNIWSEYYYSEYFKDFFKKILIEYARMPMLISANSQYSEFLPIQDWKINGETLTVANYLCQKATCTFRGRNFTAWFTMDIPIQNGPWKFGGLPGLILKVYDEDMLYTFECVKVETFKKKYPIKMYDYSNYKKIDRLKLYDFFKKIYADYFNVAGLKSMDGTPLVWKKIPYNPLELE